MTAETKELQRGDEVCCLSASIDRQIGKGMTGRITGFARFSSYHPREAFVELTNGEADWFWVSGLEPSCGLNGDGENHVTACA